MRQNIPGKTWTAKHLEVIEKFSTLAEKMLSPPQIYLIMSLQVIKTIKWIQILLGQDH